MGAEPDESHCIGTAKEFPDLVIEVIVTSGGIDRLERFRRLGVQEVWFWQNDRFLLYHSPNQLPDQLPAQFAQTYGYEAIQQSELLSDLDLELLRNCVQNPNPLAAAKAFRQGIRARNKVELA